VRMAWTLSLGRAEARREP
jgi:hypothetical protein